MLERREKMYFRLATFSMHMSVPNLIEIRPIIIIVFIATVTTV